MARKPLKPRVKKYLEEQRKIDLSKFSESEFNAVADALNPHSDDLEVIDSVGTSLEGKIRPDQYPMVIH